MTFADYLNQPCDADGCDRCATHNQRKYGQGWKVCNAHLVKGATAHARND